MFIVRRQPPGSTKLRHGEVAGASPPFSAASAAGLAKRTRHPSFLFSLFDKAALLPDFRDCIEFVFASSPLTIRDYYGNKKGSNYGFQKDSNNLMLSQLSVFTKVKNLYLTGQNVNIHGFCGVSLTAIETAEALVGYNTIVRKINNFCMNQP